MPPRKKNPEQSTVPKNMAIYCHDVGRTVLPTIPGTLDMFADFNGLGFEQLIEFYQHDHNWSNRMILGDSLLVMTSLAEKEGLKGSNRSLPLPQPPPMRGGGV